MRANKVDVAFVLFMIVMNVFTIYGMYVTTISHKKDMTYARERDLWGLQQDYNESYQVDMFAFFPIFFLDFITIMCVRAVREEK